MTAAKNTAAAIYIASLPDADQHFAARYWEWLEAGQPGEHPQRHDETRASVIQHDLNQIHASP